LEKGRAVSESDESQTPPSTGLVLLEQVLREGALQGDSELWSTLNARMSAAFAKAEREGTGSELAKAKAAWRETSAVIEALKKLPQTQ
ncbi:MAG: hypothetical protein ACOYN0_17770, partial [Phycisphaerales bacterium]